MNVKPKYLLAGILYTIALSLHAIDTKQFSGQHLAMEDGMRGQRVYTICQTGDGALWWSGKGGVERFNGSSIRFYPLGPSDNLGALYALKVKLYRAGDRLYAFDNRGYIYRYSEVYDRFEELTNVSGYLDANAVLMDVCRDGDKWWLAFDCGVYLQEDNQLKVIQSGLYTSCIFSANNQLYFGTSTGLYRLKGGDKLERVAPYNVECGYYDAAYRRIWLGTFDDGVMTAYVNGRSLAFTACKSADGAELPHNPVRSITPYSEKEMIVGIDGFGVYAVQRNGHDFSLLANANNGAQGLLHGNGVYSVLCDSWKNIVVGSYSGGIDILRTLSATTEVYCKQPGNPQSLANDHVNSILQTSQGKFVMGTDNGISMLDPATGAWQHFMPGTVVISLCEDHSGNVYVATYGKGVYVLNGQTAQQRFSVAEGTLKTDYVFSVLCARDGTLWMGCFNGKLVAKAADGIRYYDIDQVQKMVELPDGRIAVANSRGVSLVNPKTQQVTQQQYCAENDPDINYFVRDIYMKANYQLWVATDGGGVYFYDLKTKKSVHLTTKEGLPSNGARALCEDKHGRMWIATDRGMAFVDKQMKVSNVNFYAGLEREYCDHAVERLSDGQLLFGSTNGAILLAPDRVGSMNYEVRLNLLRIQPDRKGDFSDKEIARLYEMLKKRDVSLGYDDRTFELFYEGISLPNQHDIVYSYQMDGGNWSQPTSQQMIRFSQTEPGTHKMSLRCMSRTCGTVLDEVSLTITISHPWWNSWWMWCVYLLLLIGLINLFWRMYKTHERYMRLSVELAQRKPLDEANMNVGAALDGTAEEAEDDGDTSVDETFVNRVTELVVANLKDPDFTIDKLCREMAMSRTSFYIQLKSLTGKSPQDFIRVIRLERAASLLRAGKSVSDVALLTGFDNTKYFSTVFKKYFNVPPSKYKQGDV